MSAVQRVGEPSRLTAVWDRYPCPVLGCSVLGANARADARAQCRSSSDHYQWRQRWRQWWLAPLLPCRHRLLLPAKRHQSLVTHRSTVLERSLPTRFSRCRAGCRHGSAWHLQAYLFILQDLQCSGRVPLENSAGGAASSLANSRSTICRSHACVVCSGVCSVFQSQRRVHKHMNSRWDTLPHGRLHT